MLELNLLKETLKSTERNKKFVNYFKIAYLVFGCIFLLLVGLSLLNYRKISSYQKETAEIIKDIAKSRAVLDIENRENEWKNYSMQLATLEDMLNKRTIMSSLLQELSASFLPGMSVSSMLGGARQENNIFMEIIVDPKDGQGYKLIQDLIRQLGNNRFFGKNIKLESNEKMLFNGREMDYFKICIAVPKQ
jgi:hypothetical protein